MTAQLFVSKIMASDGCQCKEIFGARELMLSGF